MRAWSNVQKIQILLSPRLFPSHFHILFSVICLQMNLPLSAWLSRVSMLLPPKQILPNCTSACSLLISLNKWHSFSSHMAQLVCNANTQRTLALLIPSAFNFQRVWKHVFLCGAMLGRCPAGLENIWRILLSCVGWWVRCSGTWYCGIRIIFHHSGFMLGGSLLIKAQRA